MNVLDLFSGIGGFSLGLERAGMRTIAFCEIDPYCRAVLRKHWPSVPIFDDIRTLTADDVPGVDVICGGFPCQDVSIAGKGSGLSGERSGLWSEQFRLVREIRPKYLLVENVAALLFRGIGTVLGDLAAIGYDAEWDCIPAAAVGALHYRDRVWITAYPNTNSLRPQRFRTFATGAWSEQQFKGLVQAEASLSVPSGKSGGMVDGVRNRKHRLTALGNAVVPQIPEIIGRAIMKAIDGSR